LPLLSTHTHCPGLGHIEARKHILCYLRGSTKYRLLYQSVGIPTGTLEPNGIVSYPFCNHKGLIGFCDSNWGPQDASHPIGKADNTLNTQEACSLKGTLIVRMGGIIACWKDMRERHMCPATCEAEIKSLHECMRLVQAL
jgi:hypothetical protein